MPMRCGRHSDASVGRRDEMWKKARGEALSFDNRASRIDVD